MSIAVDAERPAEIVDDYHGIGLRLWHGKVRQHSPSACRCLACSDLRKYLGWPPLPIVIGRHTLRCEP